MVVPVIDEDKSLWTAGYLTGRYEVEWVQCIYGAESWGNGWREWCLLVFYLIIYLRVVVGSGKGEERDRVKKKVKRDEKCGFC